MRVTERKDKGAIRVDGCALCGTLPMYTPHGDQHDVRVSVGETVSRLHNRLYESVAVQFGTLDPASQPRHNHFDGMVIDVGPAWNESPDLGGGQDLTGMVDQCPKHRDGSRTPRSSKGLAPADPSTLCGHVGDERVEHVVGVTVRGGLFQ
jgi:hypothetical protein